MNPFNRDMDELFRTSRIRVIKGDTTYEGWCKRIDYGTKSVLLIDAEKNGRTETSSVVVRHADLIERVDDNLHVQEISLQQVSDSPYCSKEFDEESLTEFARHIRDRGRLPSFPVVRPTSNGFEIIAGHRRVRAAQKAGLQSVPVRVMELSDWDAMEWFVADHFPLEMDLGSDGERDDNWYSDAEMEAAIVKLYNRWGDRIESLVAIQQNVTRLSQAIESSVNVEPEDETGDMETRGDQTDASEEGGVSQRMKLVAKSS